MKKLFIFLIVAINSFALNIATTYPYIADITKAITQDKAEVFSLSNGDYDPHFITPKPSLIAKVRSANLLITNGAGLEIGWLPPLLNSANNSKLELLDLSKSIKLIAPHSHSRKDGDVHPEGNPHFILNPHNVLIVADSVKSKLCEIDNQNCEIYRHNLDEFKAKFSLKLQEWDSKLKQVNGLKVVQYHKLFDYFFKQYGVVEVATVEQFAGISPSAKHLDSIKELGANLKINFVIRATYNSEKIAKKVSNDLNAKLIILPHDVGSIKDIDNIFLMFETITKELLHE